MLPINARKKENNTVGRKGRKDSSENHHDASPSRLDAGQALDLAFRYHESGRLVEAEELCRLILEKIPGQVDAAQLLGALLSQRGQYAEAVQLLREAIGQAPGHAHLHNNLGIALHRLGETEEAVSQFNRALGIRPDFAKAHNNLGVALMELGRMDEAVSTCRQAVHLQADFKQAHNNLALALKRKGELENAVASYQKAVSLDPEYAEALSNLGMALICQGRLEEAAGNLQKAVNLVPNSAEFRNNLGVLFNRQGLFEQAVAASEKAISIRPAYVEAHNNLGTALMELGRFSEANAAFQRAISFDPECAEAHHNRSLVLLLTGQFEQGWEEYEWRWKHDGFSTPVRPFSQQLWNGSADDVRKLLVWGEQGIGDEVQFAGLIPHVVAQGIDVVVECDERLVSLLQRSLPKTIVVGRTDPPAPLLKDPSISHQIPMASIPRVLGLSLDSMSVQSPSMIADEKRRDRLRREYKGNTDPVLAGISWRSGNKQEGPKRSIGLEYWGPIFKVPGVRFVNLQYGQYSMELQVAQDQHGVEVLQDQRIDPLRDLDAFAAQVASLDLVISVDNSTVHVAGALSVNVWTMLPTVPDWRWGLEGDRIRWYPSMRLFRQQKGGRWEPVISMVARELAVLVNRIRATNPTPP